MKNYPRGKEYNKPYGQAYGYGTADHRQKNEPVQILKLITLVSNKGPDQPAQTHLNLVCLHVDEDSYQTIDL